MSGGGSTDPPAPHDPLLRDALEELVGLWMPTRAAAPPSASLDDFVVTANALLGGPARIGSGSTGAADLLHPLSDLIQQQRAAARLDPLGGLTPPAVPALSAADIAGGIAPQAPAAAPAAGGAPGWTVADLSDAADGLDVPFVDPELIAHILAMSPSAAVIVELRKAAYRLDRKTSRALFALLGALATLVRELADGPLKTLIQQLDTASLVAEIVSRHAPDDDGPDTERKRRRIDV